MRSAIYEVIGNGVVCQQFGVNGGDIIRVPKGSFITTNDIAIGRFDDYSIAGLIHDGFIKEVIDNKIQNEIQNNNHVDDENVADDELDNKKMPEKLTGKKRGRRPKNDA